MKRKTKEFVVESMAVLIFVVPVVIMFLFAIYSIGRDRNKTAESQQALACTMIGQTCYELERAITNEQQIKGLSGRATMPENKGMLFRFDMVGSHCMWMKDMKIPNDMIWLDSDNKVVKIKENISPDTYPEAFCSERPAQYVIELNSGQVARNQLKLGDTISF